MRPLSLPSGIANHAAQGCIALGLAMLIVATWWPALPVVTAYAIIALGATLATIHRFGGAAALPVVAMMHLVVYGSLYFLFVGAVWHAATRGAQDELVSVHTIDFGFSAVVMAIVVRRSLAAISGGEDAPAR
jgi:hypothetical protein